jgi:cytidylate kinase
MGESATAAGPDGSALGAGQVPRTIAVDGSAASGKSTIGRLLAAELGYPFLDTGMMYRAITTVALQRRISVDDPEALGALASSITMEVRPGHPSEGDQTRILVDGVDVTDDLRTQAVEDAVSLVSQAPGVRRAMVARQREIAGHQPVVMVGRDIGTVVLPNADLKIYLDASVEERARRRHLEFERLGRDASHDAVLEDLRRRDRIDSERAVSPLRPADDARVIDTDGLAQTDVLDMALSLAKRTG